MNNRVMSMTDEEHRLMLCALELASSFACGQTETAAYESLYGKVESAGRYEPRTGEAIAGTAGVERLRDVLGVGKVLREGDVG